MTRIVFTVLAGALMVSSACKKQSSGGAGSGSTAVAGSAAGSAGSAGSAGAAATAPDTGSGSAAAQAAGSGSGAAPAAGSHSAGSAAGSAVEAGSAAQEAMAHRAGMCPSTVFGATTKEAVRGKAVVVTIESSDKDAIKAIQRRTD